jgi:phage-related protein (TIGR01555 family)
MADDAGTFAQPYRVVASARWSQPARGPEWTLTGMDALAGGLGASAELVPYSHVPRMNPKDIFRAYQPPPGFGAAGVDAAKGGDATLAMDEAIAIAQDWDNAVGAHALQIGGAQLTQGIGFLGYPFLAELSQRPEYRKISETIAEELTRKWIRVSSISDGEDKTQKVDDLNGAIERFRVRERFHKAAELDGFMGRSQLYIDVGKSSDAAELATPLMLTPEKIAKGSLKGFRVVEPMWSYPLDYNSSDPLAENFYVPVSWAVMQRRVHASRLLTFIGRPMPDLLKPAYAFGGLSLSQMAMPYVQNWLRTRQSVSDLIHSFSVMILSTDMGATLDAEGMNKLLRRAQAAALFRDNRGLQIINKATEEFANVSAPLSGLDALQAQSQEQMASVSGIPLVKLLGITPSGLNASSDGEVRVFYDRVKATQEKFMGPNLKHVMDVLQLNEWGEVDPDIVYEWVPLWELDEAGKAAVRKTDADTGAVLIESGALATEEERKRIASAPDSPYQGLDVDDMPDPPDMGEGEEGAPDIPGAGAKASGNPARTAEPAAVERAGDHALDAEFRESDHPRDNDGKFSEGGGGGGGGGAVERRRAGANPAKLTKPQRVALERVAAGQQPGNVGHVRERLTEGGLIHHTFNEHGIGTAHLTEKGRAALGIKEPSAPPPANVHPEVAKTLGEAGLKRLHDAIGSKDHKSILAALAPAAGKRREGASMPIEHHGSPQAIAKFLGSRTYVAPDGSEASHPEIIDHLVDKALSYAGAGGVRRNREVLFVTGPPAAGKSTIAEILAERNGAAILDPDDAKKVIPEFNGGLDSSYVHEESSTLTGYVGGRLTDEGANIIYPMVGDSAEKISKKIDDYRAKGYKVGIVNLDVSADNAAQRMARRFVKTGRLIDPGYFGSIVNEEAPQKAYAALRQDSRLELGAAQVDGNTAPGEEAIKDVIGSPAGYRHGQLAKGRQAP